MLTWMTHSVTWSSNLINKTTMSYLRFKWRTHSVNNHDIDLDEDCKILEWDNEQGRQTKQQRFKKPTKWYQTSVGWSHEQEIELHNRSCRQFPQYHRASHMYIPREWRQANFKNSLSSIIQQILLVIFHCAAQIFQGAETTKEILEVWIAIWRSRVVWCRITPVYVVNGNTDQ